MPPAPMPIPALAVEALVIPPPGIMLPPPTMLMCGDSTVICWTCILAFEPAATFCMLTWPICRLVLRNVLLTGCDWAPFPA